MMEENRGGEEIVAERKKRQRGNRGREKTGWRDDEGKKLWEDSR